MPNDLNMLRPAKIGQKGFVQEDVLNMLDEYETRIEELQIQLDQAKNTGANADVNQLNNIIKTLEDRLKANDKALNNERQNFRAQLDSYEEKLRRANSSGGFNPDMEKELSEKNEAIAKKDEEIAIMQEKVQEVKNFLVQKDEDTNRRINEKDIEIAELNKTIQMLTNERENLESTINNDTTQNEIVNLQDTINNLNQTIDGLNEKVKTLNNELETKVDITDYEELSKKVNINKLGSKKIEILLNNAEEQATDTISEANEKAEQIVSEAQKTKDNAIEEATKIIAEATEKAEFTIKEAEEKAQNILKEAEISAHDKIVEINEKSENIFKTNEDFKTIIMEQIGSISDGINCVMDLINNASEKISFVTDKITDNEPLTELISNLPKEEVPTLPVEEVEVIEVSEEIINDEENSSELKLDDTIQNKNIFDIEEEPPIETKEDDIQPQFEEYIPPTKSDFKIDGLDDLLKAVEDATPDEENEDSQPQFEEYVPPVKSKSDFTIDGLDDLLKAVEESTPDEEQEVEENTYSSSSLDNIDSLLQEVESSINDIEETSTFTEPQPSTQTSFDDMDEIVVPTLEDMG